MASLPKKTPSVVMIWCGPSVRAAKATGAHQTPIQIAMARRVSPQRPSRGGSVCAGALAPKTPGAWGWAP